MTASPDAPSGPRAVDAVIFDWGGTLTPWHTVDVMQAWLSVVADDDVARRLAEAENRAWLRSRDEQRSATLLEVFADAGVEHTEQMLSAFHRWWEPHTLLDPDVPPLFDALHERGIRIGVLSNTIWPRAEHERIFERDGVAELIDAAVYTSEIAWTKPHPEAFRAALRAVGVTDPARAVFVGDRLFDDIHGAKAVGMRAILVPHSDIPSSQLGPVSGQPDAVVERLADVLHHVAGWQAQSP
jgi:putative hydrolase of the HAD superfamily